MARVLAVLVRTITITRKTLLRASDILFVIADFQSNMVIV